MPFYDYQSELYVKYISCVTNIISLSLLVSIVQAPSTIIVEQNFHSVYCASFYLRTSKKLNKYYFEIPELHTQSWILPKSPPHPTAIQNHHDNHPKSKPCDTNTNNSNNPNENIGLVTKTTATNPTKNNPQK